MRACTPQALDEQRSGEAHERAAATAIPASALTAPTPGAASSNASLRQLPPASASSNASRPVSRGVEDSRPPLPAARPRPRRRRVPGGVVRRSQRAVGHDPQVHPGQTPQQPERQCRLGQRRQRRAAWECPSADTCCPAPAPPGWLSRRRRHPPRSAGAPSTEADAAASELLALLDARCRPGTAHHQQVELRTQAPGRAPRAAHHALRSRRRGHERQQTLGDRGAALASSRSSRLPVCTPSARDARASTPSAT